MVSNIIIHVLGTAQDGGYPHAGCKDNCCKDKCCKDECCKDKCCKNEFGNDDYLFR